MLHNWGDAKEKPMPHVPTNRTPQADITSNKGSVKDLSLQIINISKKEHREMSL